MNKTIYRKTKETDISLKLDINGTGKYNIDSGMGFLNHMLQSFAKHSLIDLELVCKGDIDVDYHHSVEDIGIVLAQALKEAIYPIENIERFWDCIVVMDDARVSCALDLSNRGYLEYEVDINGTLKDFDVELIEEFFRAVAINAGITLHIVLQSGKNKHHIIEAVFKAFALSLRRALSKNSRIDIPSTKGIL
jgi:imidazoleglycerol-phosphate dehydratase